MPEIPEGAVVIFARSTQSALCMNCGSPAEIMDTVHWNQGGLDKPDGCKVTFTHIVSNHRGWETGLQSYLTSSRPDLKYLGMGYLEKNDSKVTCHLVG